MEKPFTSREIRSLIKWQTFTLNSLKETSTLLDQRRNRIQAASHQYVTQEALRMMRAIPVSELSKMRKGLKTKPLINLGYTTVADVYQVPQRHLALIRGISENAAYTIHRLVENIAEKTFGEVRIRLSIDHKTEAATEIVKSIYSYQKSKPIVDSCRQYLEQHEEKIHDLCRQVRPGRNAILWLFSSRKSKEQAISAYYQLKELLNGNYGAQTKSLVKQLKQVEPVSEEEAWNSFAVHSPTYYSMLEDINPGALGTSDSVYGLPDELAHEVEDQCFFPNGLLCTLRRYQEWGVKYILHQERVLLGDEMGLGKTIQAIATMVSLKNTGETHFVVICPASVLTNWVREIRKQSKLRVVEVHGSQRNAAIKDWMRYGGVAVTTYETTRYFHLNDNTHYALTVVDEAHYIKNPDAQRTQNSLALCQHSSRILFMTGTALENNVEEMITLIRNLQPEVADVASKIAFLSSAPEFREKVAPVYYRRKRSDVLSELPELIESKEWCSLSPEEESVYEKTLTGGQYMQARRVSWNVEDLRHSAKANRLLEIVQEAESEGRKVLVFSYFLDTIRKIYEFLGSRCLNPITGSVAPQERQAIIDEFEKAPGGTVLLSQILSGGTGLNIQAASVIVICEPQLKPSIENQAISRAYRMGQVRNVLVYRLLSPDTIDERITSLLEDKQRIFDAFADKSVAAQQNLEVDQSTFQDLIKEEIDRINKKKGVSPGA